MTGKKHGTGAAAAQPPEIKRGDGGAGDSASVLRPPSSASWLLPSSETGRAAPSLAQARSSRLRQLRRAALQRADRRRGDLDVVDEPAEVAVRAAVHGVEAEAQADGVASEGGQRDVAAGLPGELRERPHRGGGAASRVLRSNLLERMS